RHLHLSEAARVNAPHVRACDDDPLVYEHLDKLFDVEGVPLGPADDHLAQVRRHAARALQNLLDELAALFLRERLKTQTRVALAPLAPRRPAFEERRTRQTQNHHGRVGAVAREVVYEVERAVVGPVYVVEVEEDWKLARDVGEELRGVVERAVAYLPRVVAYAGDVRARGIVEAYEL